MGCVHILFWKRLPKGQTTGPRDFYRKPAPLGKFQSPDHNYNFQFTANMKTPAMKDNLRPVPGGGVLDQILDGDGDVPSKLKDIPVPYINCSKLYTRLYTYFLKIYTRPYTNSSKICTRLYTNFPKMYTQPYTNFPKMHTYRSLYQNHKNQYRSYSKIAKIDTVPYTKIVKIDTLPDGTSPYPKYVSYPPPRVSSTI